MCRSFRLGTWTTLVIATASAAVGAQERPSGVLFGFPSGRTLWIAAKGDSMRLAADKPWIIVPRPDGYWAILTVTRCGLLPADESYGAGGGAEVAYTARTRTFGIGRPGKPVDLRLGSTLDCEEADSLTLDLRRRQYRAALDSARGDSSRVHQPRPGSPADPGYVCLDEDRQVTFLTPEVISVEARSSQTEACSPGGYTNSFDNTVTRLAGGAPLKVAPLLSPRDRRSFRARPDTASGEEHLCAADGTIEQLESGWIVHRRDGQWVVDSWASGPNACRGGNSLEYGLSLPRSFTRDAPLRLGWPFLSRTFPGLQDAWSSPDRKWIALFVGGALEIHRVERGAVGPLRLRVPGIGETPVMTIWATPAQGARWNRDLPALKRPRTIVQSELPSSER